MSNHSITLSALFCLSFLLPTSGIAQSVEDVFEEGFDYSLIDEMPAPQRAALVAELGGALDNRTEETARILCIIRPWTTGTSKGDAELTNLLQARIDLQEDAESAAFRWLDCATANRLSGYRSKVLDPMQDLRAWLCIAPRDPTERVSAIADTIASVESFDVESEVIARGSALRSYYPARNALRLANLHAGLAVAALDQDDPERASLELSAAVDVLDRELARLETPEDIARTRNGWRIRGDLQFHRELYSQLSAATLGAQVGPPPENGDAFGRPAATIAALRPAISPHLAAEMGPDYVDPIYIERLLPGAAGNANNLEADASAECGQWRRRSYAPEALVQVWAGCADTMGLHEFDACFGKLEANDWTLSFVTVAGGIESTTARRAFERVEDYVGQVVEQLPNKSTNTLEPRLEELLRVPAGNGLVTIDAAGTFTTSERRLLNEIFSRVELYGIRPLFRRPKQF